MTSKVAYKTLTSYEIWKTAVEKPDSNEAVLLKGSGWYFKRFPKIAESMLSPEELEQCNKFWQANDKNYLSLYYGEPTNQEYKAKAPQSFSLQSGIKMRYGRTFMDFGNILDPKQNGAKIVAWLDQMNKPKSK